MTWTGGDRIKEMKFLVDLQQHTYISEKSHQEIIDRADIVTEMKKIKHWYDNDCSREPVKGIEYSDTACDLIMEEKKEKEAVVRNFLLLYKRKHRGNRKRGIF
jgi:hypothetical protein